MCFDQAVVLPSADTPSRPVVQKTGNLPRPPVPNDERAARLHALRQKARPAGTTGTTFGAGRDLSMITTATNQLIERVNGATFNAGGKIKIRKTAHGGEITEEVKNVTYTAGNNMTLRREAANIGVTQEGVSSESDLGSVDLQTTATKRATIKSSHSTTIAGENVEIGYHAENLRVDMTNDAHYGNSDERIIMAGKKTELVVDGVKRSADALRRGK